jgi:hypothetical protein
MCFPSGSEILQRGETFSMGVSIFTHPRKKRKELHMNEQIDQAQQSLFERKGTQEVGEEQLEDIRGGVLDTPGRG